MKPVAKLNRKARRVISQQNLMFRIQQQKQNNLKVIRSEYLTFVAMLFGHKIELGESLVKNFHNFSMGELSEEFLLRSLMLKSERHKIEAYLSEQKEKALKEQEDLLARLKQQNIQETRKKR